MAYKSEADQLRDKLEFMTAQYVTVSICNTDLLEWNRKLAEETLSIRETNRLLRVENAMVRLCFSHMAWMVALITYWNIIT
jgi:hypothetical protein